MVNNFFDICSQAKMEKESVSAEAKNKANAAGLGYELSPSPSNTFRYFALS
jgi:hypothetical protein